MFGGKVVENPEEVDFLQIFAIEGAKFALL